MNDLFHWGIPGMKWGVRRANRRAAAQARQSEDHKTVAGLRKKKVREMSNDELKKLTTRLQLEKQLKDLTKSDPSFSQKFITDVLGNSTKQLASKFVTDTFLALGPAFAKAKNNPPNPGESFSDYLIRLKG